MVTSNFAISKTLEFGLGPKHNFKNSKFWHDGSMNGVPRLGFKV